MQTSQKSLSASRCTPPDAREVEAAERKIGAVLSDLEEATGGDVRDLDLDHVVDTDTDGRPVLQKKVDVKLQPKRERHWAK